MGDSIMTFQIKAFKHWATDDGGGYQFNLYHNKKKFAWVHNDGNGGCIDIRFEKPEYSIIWDAHIKSLGKWKSSCGEIHGTEWFDHDSDTAIGILVEEYEMSKHRKKGILFRLLTDSENAFRTIKTHDMQLATEHLDKLFGKGKYELI
jgi:hypothetical protein